MKDKCRSTVENTVGNEDNADYQYTPFSLQYSRRLSHEEKVLTKKID